MVRSITKEDVTVGKIVFDKRKDKITIINKLAYPESVNERVYSAVSSGIYEGFMPVNMKQKRNETSLECIIQGYITLNEYFGGTVTKRMFLNFVYEIIRYIKICEKNLLNANNLDLQSDRIFIDPYSKSVKCIYWPIVNNQRANPVDIFLKQLPYDIFFNPNEDCDYIKIYENFFDGIKPFSIKNFERMILELQGKKMNNICSAPSGPLFSTSKDDENEEKKKEQGIKNKNIEYDPFAKMDFVVQLHNDEKKTSFIRCFCESCGTEVVKGSNFCPNCGTRIQSVENDDVSSLDTIIVSEESAGTTLLGYKEEVETNFPTIVRKKTGERFTVNKLSYRIGKKRELCDLYVSDNKYISRNHADILTIGDRYYIIDRGSTNKTYINDKVIPAEQKIEIFSGTRIRLGNEDFVFSI